MGLDFRTRNKSPQTKEEGAAPLANAVALRALVPLLALLAGSAFAAGQTILRLDPALDQLIAPGTKVEKVAGGFKFTEGPMWRGGRLWFVDVVGDTVNAVTPDGKVEVLVEKAGGFPNKPPASYNGPNAMVTDRDGSVLMAQQGGRKVVRIDAQRHLVPFLDVFEGHRFNSPNDLVFAPDGSLWFTDPTYGLAKGDADSLKELPFNAVYCYQQGRLSAVIKDLSLPNGLGFSPDGRVLYVANSGPAMRVMQYEVKADGSVSDGTVLIEYPSGATGPGAPDGLKLDAAGNLWSTGPGGIRIITPQGKVLGQIQLPETAANLAWSGDGKTLYITAQTSIYRIHTLVTGELPLYRR